MHASLVCAPAHPQRLKVENVEQQELIGQLLHRVEKLETLIEEEQARLRHKGGGMFGGFFAPRGL
jgi:hypothetical protein